MTTALYGINTATSIYYEKHQEEDEFIFVTTKGGEKFHDFTSLSLTEFANFNFSKIDRVVICSSFVGEITHSLLQHDFPIEKIYCFDTYNVQVSSCADIKRDRISKDEILYAFYDLANNWVTFDCIAFCILAELERQKRGKKYIHFLIVPDHSCDVEFIGAHECQSPESRSWRIDHILKAVFSCVPSLLSVSHLAFREEADMFTKNGVSYFPDRYKSTETPLHFAHAALLEHKEKGRDLSIFRAPDQARNIVRAYLSEKAKGLKPVVIGLRENNIQTSRNSNLAEWAKFIDTLDKNIYFPIVVRDFYKSYQDLPCDFKKVNVFPNASADFSIRVALYEAAYVNLSITNGAYYITNFMKDVAAVTIVDLDPENPCMSESTWAKGGYTRGQDCVLRDNKAQQVIWGKDKFENIVRAFERVTSSL